MSRAFTIIAAAIALSFATAAASPHPVVEKLQDYPLEELNMADAYWFPWDTADGEGEEGYFRLSALSIAPDTVVEFRDLRLVRGLLYLKPDYERPITWPVRTDNADGSVEYSLTYKVINSSGRPTDITARIASSHERFKVSLDKATQPVKASRVATFTLTATMSKADIGRSKELYAEPLRVIFGLSHRPEVSTLWTGQLVRPRVATVASDGRGVVVVTLTDHKRLAASLKGLIEKFPAKQ